MFRFLALLPGDIYKFGTDLLWLSHFRRKGKARYLLERRNGDNIKVSWINQKQKLIGNTYIHLPLPAKP